MNTYLQIQFEGASYVRLNCTSRSKFVNIVFSIPLLYIVTRKILSLLLSSAQSSLKISFLDAGVANCDGFEEKGRTMYQTYNSNRQVIWSDMTVATLEAELIHRYSIWNIVYFLLCNLYSDYKDKLGISAHKCQIFFQYYNI